MNSHEADRQIEQMIAFIAQEAKEKAEEIQTKTEKEFMAEKLSLETQLSQQIRNEHEKNKKQHYITKRIEKSKALTSARFETMRRRDDKMNLLKKAVLERLQSVASSPKYSELLRYLIAQGLMTLMENGVTLQVRKEDLALVKKELPVAIQLFQDTMKKSTGVQPSINVAINETEFLPPAPKKDVEGASCVGGIILSARNGQILCRNTLDHRLTIAFEQLKPGIRGSLFGVREKLVSNAPVERHGVSLPK
jgi:V-type H+-transporting ATPase subunit E